MTEKRKGGRPKGPCPSNWKYPGDRIRTDKHRGYLRAKAQWNYRGEGCEMTTDEWQAIWTDELWAKRGRLPNDYCLVRDDDKEAWHPLNVMMVTRRLQLIMPHYLPDMYQMPNGVWDITGETLKKWEENVLVREKYKGRYARKQQTPKKRGL